MSIVKKCPYCETEVPVERYVICPNPECGVEIHYKVKPPNPKTGIVRIGKIVVHPRKE